MKSAKKVNLPPIPSNSLHNRTTSANQQSDVQDREKLKKIPTTQNIKTLDPHQTIPESIPKYKPAKYQSNQNNPIVEETKTYIDNLKKGAYNILVCVRCRPLSPLECQLSTSETIRIMDNKILVLMDPIEYNGPSTVFKNRTREQTYAFDFAFDKYSSQITVFENSTKFLIDGIVNGYNATVFAYGATGAGKTYTMLGNESNPGIMPLTLQELFKKVNKYKDREYKLKFWYLEIYNENIRDLLKFIDKPSTIINDDNEYLDLREDPVKGIMVSGITEVNVNNSNDMLKILKRGNRNRTIEATGANETSSRSHAILQVSIEYKEKNSGIDYEIKYSKLSLVDLAGSERASNTQNRGIRLIEGANINRSLLTLGNCINALCDAVAKGIKKPYVPYRDSKLTRLLKDSLGGNARTVMIANVSPSINTFDDTYNTLKYANRAKNIKTVVTRNVLNAQYHISNYVNIINGLKNEVNQLKKQLQLQKINKNFNEKGKNISINNEDVAFSSNNTNIAFSQSNQTKDSFNTNIINNFNEERFNDTVKEIKKACDCQITVKQKIISGQNEINKLSEIIEMNKNINSINNNLSNLISFTGTKNSKENSQNSINDNNNQESNNENNLNEKINELKNNVILNQNRYKEFSKIIEKIYKSNSIKYNYSDLQKDFLTNIIKNANYKIQMLDIQYKNMLIKAKNDIKNEYIKELEKQIKYRDDIIKEHNIDISAKISMNNLIKELDVLKNEYKQKLSKNFNMNINLFAPNEKFHSIYCTNPNRKNINNYNMCPKSNTSQLNRINMKYNTNNPSTNLNIINNNNMNNNPKKQLSQSKLIVIKNENNSLRPGSKTNSRQLQIKNRPGIQYKNLKRNNKSYAYKEPKVLNKENGSRKNTLNKKDLIDIIAIAQKHNKSFNEEDNYHQLKRFSLKSNSVTNRIKNNNDDEGRFITFEEMPHVKKRELNFLLNERNKKRQKFLDKINAGNKDLL
jgi:kinesin family protein 18/19